MRKAVAILIFVTVTCPVTVAAYEIDTHALITSYAYDSSVLNDDALTRRLGIDRFGSDEDNPPFGIGEAISYAGRRDAYYDLDPADWNSLWSNEDTRPDMPYDWANMYGDAYREVGRDRLLLKGWLMRGAIREDDLPLSYITQPPYPDLDPHGETIRVYHHFFDPVHDAELLGPSVCAFLPDGLGKCYRSTDWAFGRLGAASAVNPEVDTQRRNHFTWADARNAMWCALTQNDVGITPSANVARNAAERRLCWATTIKSLGHVLHLLEDTSQPQHVRDDRHNPASGLMTPFGTSTARRTFEAWTNYRVLGGEEITGVEDDDAEFTTFFDPAVALANPLDTGKNYPIPRFSEPQYYFSTRQVETATTPASLRKRRGLADLANRGFFSEGTVLDDKYPLPPSAYDSPELKLVDRVIAPSVIERHIGMALTDPLKGSYVDTALAPFDQRVPLATVSLWQDFNTGDFETVGGVISLDEYSAHADVLVPRAIAYSAGLIDYFFRGKLEITPPLDGLFSVIDHGTPHTVDADGYPRRSDDGKVFGFTKLRLRVRNATEVVNESGTNLPIPRDVISTYAGVPSQGDPTLLAVARYHRNPCYRPDLSGERRMAFDGQITEPGGCGADGTRTLYQQVSVSKAVVSAAASLNGAGQDLVFDFGNQPIPVNATDLAIQVVYRGPLGLEDDAIAVGLLDVREPTYLTHWNNTDYAACNGASAKHGATPAGCILHGVGAQRAIVTTRVCIGTQMVFEHLQNPHGTLGSGNYVRLTALLDEKTKATRTRSIVDGYPDVEIRDRTIAGHLRQSNKEQVIVEAPFVSDPFYAKRGFVGSLRPMPYYQRNGADPQPANDSGPMDVGGLAGTLPFFFAPDPGNVVFPDVGVSSMACTTANAKAIFADEKAHATAVKTATR